MRFGNYGGHIGILTLRAVFRKPFLNHFCSVAFWWTVLCDLQSCLVQWDISYCVIHEDVKSSWMAGSMVSRHKYFNFCMYVPQLCAILSFYVQVQFFSISQFLDQTSLYIHSSEIIILTYFDKYNRPDQSVRLLLFFFFLSTFFVYPRWGSEFSPLTIDATKPCYYYYTPLFTFKAAGPKKHSLFFVLLGSYSAQWHANKPLHKECNRLNSENKHVLSRTVLRWTYSKEVENENI